MDFSFFFGPDKTPFVLHENSMAEAASAIPFHGIISRGLLNKFKENNLSFTVWYENAHLLERDGLNNDSDDRNLLKLREYTAECRVLSFSQSAACAKLFIEKYCADLTAENTARCEIWNLKEGHTSSVWKVSIFDSNSKAYHFVVNVARDNEAGFELENASERMKAIAEHCPDINMAKVYDIQKILSDDDDNPYEVVITKNEWIEDSSEIHMINDKVSGKEQYILVERFLTKEDAPSQVTSIGGRRFSDEESSKIKADIDLFLNNASSDFSLNININNGDVVWDGERAIVIAIS
jgi:hypothetical protein